MYIEDNLYTGVQALVDEGQGPARFFFSSSDLSKIQQECEFTFIDSAVLRDDFVDIDLIISGVSIANQDFMTREEYIGDSFSLHFYGAKPVGVRIEGYLFANIFNKGKEKFLELYKQVLRLKRVVKLDIIPKINVNNFIIGGALTSVNLAENSSQEDVINVAMNFLVLEIDYD